MINSID